MVDKILSDFHIHSRFSRACSKSITLPELVKWAKIKGLDLLGTGDFTHPLWFKEIQTLLKPNGKGFYYLGDFPFIITGEISLIYTQEHGRRVHLLLLIPSIEVAEKIHAYLDTKGRRDYDGRPIFKISCEEFTKEMKKISNDIEIIPAHVWTPWFGVLGSKSGFDGLKEAFGSEFENIFAIETGISSDPKMNWKIKEFEKKSIISFSDAHSFWPWRIGREATIFKKTDSYLEIIRQIRENDFISTIEANPCYGIYHWDGHRNCNFSCSPEKTRELKEICPKCGQRLTLGVDFRVSELSDANFKYPSEKPYLMLLPLHEIISLCLGVSMQSKKSWDIYNDLIDKFENEFNILINVKREEFIQHQIDAKLIGLILKNRIGKIKVKPGFDGLYGKAVLEEEQKKLG